MQEKFEKAIDLIKNLKADYGDIRAHIKDETESFGTLCGTLDYQDYSIKQGYGIRVLYKGAWGFASSENFDEIENTVKKAFNNAVISSGMTGGIKVDLGSKTIYKESYSGPVNTDPFTVPLKDKVGHFLKLDSLIKHDKLSYWGAQGEFYKKEILYMDTDGSVINKHITDVNGTLYAFANDKDGFQQRRFHHLFYNHKGSSGWDTFLDADLFTSYAPKITEELLAVCNAPKCETEICDLIILNNQMALQTHETIGHALELDRILGYELSYAGGSFVNLHDFGSLKYGSSKLTARADATLLNSPGSFGFDDDGIKARNIVLIDKGILKNAVSSRQMINEANKKAGKKIFDSSAGANRAASYNRIPIERMTNINIDPGNDGDLNDLISGCENGLMIDSPSSWSIGSNRENFHFACEIGWKIKNGKISHVVKNPSYRGDTVKFWNSLDKVGNKDTWRLEVVFNCGKGQPNQIMRLGHGIPICLFKNVQAGN